MQALSLWFSQSKIRICFLGNEISKQNKKHKNCEFVINSKYSNLLKWVDITGKEVFRPD